MISKAALGVLDAFILAWTLKRPFLLSHLAFNVIVTAFLAPFVAFVMRSAIALSGKPALSDFDIAFFLLSPLGFVAMLLAAGFLLALYVMNSGFMMAIALKDRHTGAHSFQDGVAMVMPRAPQLVEFGGRLAVRVLAIAVPFLLAAGAIYLWLLTEFDINYYLKEHPPEFIMAAICIGAILLVMGVILAWYLLGWAVALPLVMFQGMSPKQSFAASKDAMQDQRMALFLKMLGIGVVTVGLFGGAMGFVGMLADMSIDRFAHDLKSLSRVLIVYAGVWGLLNLLFSTLSTGAMAALLVDQSGWPMPAQAREGSTSPLTWVKPVLVVGVLVCAGFGVSGVLGLKSLKTTDQIEVIAHRGAAGARPENTMASIEKALDDQTDWVEIDVQETADGEVVVLHDSDFMKIAGVNLKIWDATLQDVAQIDIGSWFDPEYADQRAPLLSEVLLAAKGRAGVLIELKYYGHDEMLEQRVADIVDATGMQDHVKAMSLKLAGVQKMKALRPDWDVGLLATASIGRIWQLETDFLAVNKSAASHFLVRKMREEGKKIYVWTVNDPLSMSHMASLGVSGIITDEPAMAHRVLAQRATLSAPERFVLSLGSMLGASVETKVYRDVSP